MVHPKDVSLVCDAALTTLGCVYHWAERIGHIPAVIALNIGVLLPRPDAGFRPIGLLPGFCRVFGKTTREEVDRWEATVAREYHYGSKGRS
eukprot:3054446-Pyramimonas_sp.AAC.1